MRIHGSHNILDIQGRPCNLFFSRLSLQASAVQERFQAAVVEFQGVLTITNIVRLWMQSSHLSSRVCP